MCVCMYVYVYVSIFVGKRLARLQIIRVSKQFIIVFFWFVSFNDKCFVRVYVCVCVYVYVFSVKKYKYGRNTTAAATGYSFGDYDAKN